MADQFLTLAVETSTHNPATWALSPSKRAGHVVVLGADTSAKRGLLLNAMAQDIEAGAGVAVIDITGRYVDQLLDTIPGHRVEHTYLFQPYKSGRVIGFNPFHGIAPDDRANAAQSIVELFKIIWDLDYDRQPLLIDLLRSCSRVLLDSADGTLVSLYAMLTNDAERQRLVSQCEDSLTHKFWRDFEALDERWRREAVQPVLTRLRAFLSDPQLRNVFGQRRGNLSLETQVHQRKVFLADLSRHHLGPETSRLFASVFITRLQTILDARQGGWPFYVYLPQAQDIHVALAAKALSRQVANGGVITEIDQLAGHAPEHRAPLLSAGCILSFRLGPDDARLVAGRYRLPQAETALTALADDRMAISGEKYEWRAVVPELTRRQTRKHIARRSAQGLGAPRCKVEQAIDRYIEGL